MLRSVSWTLRQRRYAALAAFMLVLALGCAAAGTFEVHRYRQKRSDNAALITNIHAPAVPLTPALVPVVGQVRAPDAVAIRFRRVSATGSYLPGRQQYVGNVEQGGRPGFYVLTPLRTATGTLLVLRGFVAAGADASRPAHVPSPPAGTVTVAVRLHDVDPAQHGQGGLAHEEITAIVPAEQRQRLGEPVFQAYADLAPGQPGTAGLGTLPAPPLHNPTSGASEWQLLSYVVQWYAFALLALVAPFLFSRGEAREARRRFLGIDPGAEQFDDVAGPDERAGRSSAPALESASSERGGDLAVRARGELAERADDAQWQHAVRLADRYGVSLGDGVSAAALRRARTQPAADATVRDSSTAAHRSQDAYHGAYNDYLWQLALADGNLPDVFGDTGDAAVTRPAAPDRPRIVELAPAPPDEPDRPADDR